MLLQRRRHRALESGASCGLWLSTVAVSIPSALSPGRPASSALSEITHRARRHTSRDSRARYCDHFRAAAEMRMQPQRRAGAHSWMTRRARRRGLHRDPGRSPRAARNSTAAAARSAVTITTIRSRSSSAIHLGGLDAPALCRPIEHRIAVASCAALQHRLIPSGITRCPRLSLKPPRCVRQSRARDRPARSAPRLHVDPCWREQPIDDVTPLGLVVLAPAAASSLLIVHSPLECGPRRRGR